MAKIKQVPEDFVVKEITNVKIGDNGDYAYFILKKKEWNTPDAVRAIAQKLKIEEKRVGFAGNKDKNAVTEQLLSFYRVDKKRIGGLKIKDVELKFQGYGSERINLGCLEGNEFVITIRDLANKLDKRIESIPNYFDDQRFGVEKTNHLVGKALVKKDFEEACDILGMEVEGKDYVGSLRKLSKKQLRFFINAYQSFLWNELASSMISEEEHFKVEYSLGTLAFPKNKIKNKKVALPGFLNCKGYEDIFKEEGITRKDFVIRQVPELSSEGAERDLVVEVKDFKTISFGKDDFNKGKFKQTVSFKLPKGSYATVVVKSQTGNI